MDNNISIDINIPKKRGRKPKAKLDTIIVVKPKKRGRKPMGAITEDIKIPKKRGRKPNIFNNKTPQINISNELGIKTDNILHLKISSNNINENYLDNDMYQYNPNLNDPMPYENLDSFNVNNNYLSIEEKINKNEQESVNDINSNNNLPENINKTCNNSENDNTENDNNLKFKNINNIDNNEGNILINYNRKKKTIIPVMYYYNDSNKRKKWPSKSNIKCLWCCNNFENYPCALPIKLKMKTFYVFGNFCSKECVAAYNFDTNENSNVIWDRYVSLNYLYSLIENEPDLKINLAPPRLCLNDFGGYLSIKEFRETSKNSNYKVLFPPMVSIIPSIEENFKDKLKKSDNHYIPIDKDRISKVNNDLRLKRKNPIMNKNTLENCMMLKYNY